MIIWKIILFALIVGLSYCDNTTQPGKKMDCVFKYNASESSFTKKFDCKYKNCWIDVAPSDTHSILLQISTSSANSIATFVYSYLKNGNKTVSLKGEYKSNRTYFAPPGDGFMFRRASGSCESAKLPEFKFSTVSHDRSICDSLISYVGNNQITEIQSAKTSKYAGNCAYRVLPEIPQQSTSETLYLISSDDVTFSTYVNGDKTNKKVGKTIVVKNWTSVDFRMDYEKPKKYENTEVASIFGVSTNRSCSCNSIQDATSYSFTSPGSPDFLCPSTHCSSLVSFPTPDNLTSEFLERKLVTVSGNSWRGVSLHLKSDTIEFEFSHKTFSMLNATFVVNDEDLLVTYQTTQELNLGPEGQYKVDIQPIIVPRDCDCSLFSQKIHAGSHNKAMVIPDHCDILFCDWTLIPDDQQSDKMITLFLENGQDGDEIQIWNHQFTEVYDSEVLKNPRHVNIADMASADTHIFFLRRKRRNDSALHIAFDNVEGTACNKEESYDVNEDPLAISSSNYPLEYPLSERCKMLLDAQEGYYVSVLITDADIENFHDEVIFYDGETNTDEPIRHVTGLQKNLVINSTGQMMLIEFTSDDHNSKKGFHLVAVAVPIEGTAPKNGTKSENLIALDDVVVSVVPTNATEEQNSTETGHLHMHSIPRSSEARPALRNHVPVATVPTTHTFLFSFLILVLFVGSLLGIFGVCRFLKKKYPESCRTTSFNNVNVRYRAEDNDSIVTIEA